MKKIEFFSSVQGVSDVSPIIQAKDYVWPWIEDARADYKQKINDADGATFFHIYRCPGIVDLLNYGFLVTAWCDVTIETRLDNPYGFKWTLPNTDISNLLKEAEWNDIVQSHGVQHNGTARLLPFPPNTLKSIVKINTPWHIVAPKGMKFMLNPIPYTSDPVFSMAPGLWDPAVASEMNFQLYWHKLEGKHTIKTGTPIAHLIPITEDKYQFECRDANEHDHRWLKKMKYFNNLGFMFKRNFIKAGYEKHFAKKKCPFSGLFK